MASASNLAEDAPAYPSGRPIREGDWVTSTDGTRGRVREVLPGPAAAAQGYSGAGVVVDAPPRGFVFLTVDLLREESVQFISRGPGETFRFNLGFTLVVAWLLALPVFYSFLSALWSAWFTGQVMVISIGRTETHTELVPWPRGWARFAAPPLLLLSLWAHDDSRGANLRWWAAGVGAATALVLLAFSSWFSSWHGTITFLLFSTWMGAVLAVAHRLGRTAAIVFIILSAVSLLWRAGASQGWF